MAESFNGYRIVLDDWSIGVNFSISDFVIKTLVDKSMQKARPSKFSGWMKTINGLQKPTDSSSELLVRIKTHTLHQSPAQILIPSEYALDVSHGDIITIQIEQTTDQILLQVSSLSFEHSTNSKNDISVLKTIVDLFSVVYDEGQRFKGHIKKLPQESYFKYHIQFVQVVIKVKQDQCISVYDRYRIAQYLVGSVIYPLKILEFQKLRVQIFNLFSNGNIPKMGILTQTTKVIYRTGSSTHTILIEFTKDMFDLDYYQQMYLQRVVELLKVFNLRNTLFKTTHNIEIVFFARMFYPQFKTLNQAYDFMVGEVQKLHSQEASSFTSINLAVAFQKDVRGRIYEDCYRKIIWCQHYGSLTAFVWKKIGEFLYTINWKQNIKPLAAKILLKVEREFGKTYTKSSATQTHGLGDQDLKIKPFVHFLQCELSQSQSSNILEAIILAAQQQGKDYYGTNLFTTGNAITVLSAGHSRYYTDPATYRLAKSTVYLNNISCMLINLREKKPQLQIIQIKGPSNLVEENSDSKMNMLIYGCLEALIYSSPLRRELYQHPRCFENRMAIKLSHLKQITEQNQERYFNNMKLGKLQCGHQAHFVVEEVPDQSSSASYEEKVKNPYWLNYCYLGSKALRIHNKYYDIKEGMDPAKLYLYGPTGKDIQVLPIYRHADQQLFEIMSLGSKTQQANAQTYMCQSNIERLGTQLDQRSTEQAIFQNQVCSKVYLSRCVEKQKMGPMDLIGAVAKSVFFKDNDFIMQKKESSSSKKLSKNQLVLRMRTSSIFQEDRYSMSDMEPCMFFTNFIRRVSSQFKSRNRHNFIDLKIHYLMPYFSDQAVTSLKSSVFRDNADFNRIHREFQIEWNWKLLCFPLLTPITTASDLESLRIIQRQSLISPDAKKVKLLVGLKLNQGFQLVSEPQKISSRDCVPQLYYHLMKGHLYYPIEVLDEENLILRECQVIDKNTKTSLQNLQNQDLIKNLQQKHSDMLYRYLCYEEKEFRFVPKRTYFKNDNSWHKIKSSDQRFIKVSMIIDTSNEKTLDREKYRSSCGDNFKEFINSINEKFGSLIPEFKIQVTEGSVSDIPVLRSLPIKIKYLNTHLEIFKDDQFLISYQTTWNPRCTFNLTISWNGCLSIYVNEFLNSILSSARFGKKIIPCLVPGSAQIFETEWKFQSPAQIVFSHQISMDLLMTSMEEGWAWDRNGFFFNKDGFSFVKFYKQRNLLLWKDNYKQIVEAKEVPESKFLNFFIKACVYDIVGEMIENMFIE